MNYKKLIKNVFTSLVLLMALSCDVDSSAPDHSTNFAQLSENEDVTILENSGEEVDIIVVLGGPQDNSTQIDLDVTGGDGRYMLSSSSFSIPAGETSATVTLTAIDDDEINGDVDVIVTLSSSSSVPVGIVGQGVGAISKNITIVDDNVPCNDYVITITTDLYGNETYWYIMDESGSRVIEGGPYPDNEFGNANTVNVTLADGCYTFRIWDEYGDGQVSGDGDGSYLVNCNAIIQASGAGVFDNVGLPGATGADLPTGFAFQADPNAVQDLIGFVESTDFCVNQ